MLKFNNDAQALAFVQGQAYKINSKIYEDVHPDWDFGKHIYVNTEGPEWAPGALTYTSSMSGQADWYSPYAKDIPLADVSQDFQLRTFHMAAIGYQYNYNEVQTAIQIGAPLPERRAKAARLAYQKFMYNLVLFGDPTKNLGGITNHPGVPIVAVPNDGVGGVRHWLNNAGEATKTPVQIVRDINLMLSGIARSTFDTVLADTIKLPAKAVDYIASTPYATLNMETILSFVQRTNLYTLRTGRPLTIQGYVELEKAATNTTAPSSAGGGRAVAYNNSPEYLQLHLPVDHRFLPVWQDGPLNYLVPGIFRTGGVEVMSTAAIRYIDGITEAP